MAALLQSSRVSWIGRQRRTRHQRLDDGTRRETNRARSAQPGSAAACLVASCRNVRPARRLDDLSQRTGRGPRACPRRLYARADRRTNPRTNAGKNPRRSCRAIAGRELADNVFIGWFAGRGQNIRSGFDGGGGSGPLRGVGARGRPAASVPKVADRSARAGAVRRLLRQTATAVSPSIVSGRVVATTSEPEPTKRSTSSFAWAMLPTSWCDSTRCR